MSGTGGAMTEAFPKNYEKPMLLDVFRASAAGWAAKCQGGSSPNQTPIYCARGSSSHLQNSEGFISPEILGEGL